MSNELTLNDGGYLIRAEFDTQISTAKAYPRSVARFVEEATAIATSDLETAESCIYALPRGRDRSGNETFVKGESIRLAEIAASAWGNLHAATRIVENDGKTITAEGVAWDLEKNFKVCKQVKRSISKKDGGTFSQDMQTVTGNAASSIALRNAILSVIPRALVKRVYDAATNMAIGDQTKLVQKVEALFARFTKLGINQSKILAYFGKANAADITKEEVEEMIGFGTAIKERNITIEQAFTEDKGLSNSKTDELNERLEAAAHAKKVADDFMGKEEVE